MRLKNIPLIIILLILSYTNSYSQIWTQCTNGIYGSVFGVDNIASIDSVLFANANCRGIYKSTDNGVNWFFAAGNLGYLLCVYNFYVNGTELFACTSSGLFSTTNHGQNWIPRGFNTGYTAVGRIIKTGANLVLALEYSHTVYYSTNNGLNWISCAGVTSVKDFIIVGNTLFAASAIGVFASTDNGVTWQERNNGIAYNTARRFAYFNNALYVSGEWLYRTTNDGMSWIQCDNGFFYDFYGIRSFAIHNGLLYAGTAFRGIYKTTDGSNWLPAKTGIDTSQIVSLLSYNTTLFAASTFAKCGLFATTNNGQNWNSTGFEVYTVNSIVENHNNILVSTDIRGIYSSSDYGDTWYMANLDMKNKSVLCLARQNAFVFAGTKDSGVYKSSNNGQNWIKSNSGLNNYSIKSLYTKDTILYCGTNSGAYKTTNSGENWNFIGLQNTQICAFYVYNNYYFAGTNNGIRISTDGGTSWASNLTGDSVISLYSFSEKILAGTNHGVKVSTDFGNNWVSIGLANYRINSFTNMADTLVTSTNNGVFATTNMGNNWINLGPKQPTGGLMIYNNKIYAGGVNCVWRKDANILTGVSINSTEVPDKYLLHQNYPNPFNPNTVIRYQLPVVSDVIIKVYDVQGREVRTLVNERMQAGTYEVNFDGSGLNSGVYFYQIRAGDYRESRRMILLK